MTEFSVETLAKAIGDDAEFDYKISGFSGRYRVEVASFGADLIIDQGKIVSAEHASADPADLGISVPADVLAAGTRNPPEPGTESAFIAQARGVVFHGDFATLVAPYAGALSRTYDLLRRLSGVAEVTIPSGQKDLFENSDTAVGRYARVEVEGVTYRVYYETAGEGETVLLLQHTAGADGRQWHHQLADPEFQRRFRVISYDMPYHGRSLPPTSERWWERPYLPTKQWMMAFVLAFMEKLSIDRPIFMGCSVGGQLALDLASAHGDRFKGLVSLNGTLDNPRPGDPYMAAWNNMCRDNRISTEIYSTGNYNGTSPLGPEPFRRELYWIYRSNFPGIYAGDNDYFLEGHDLNVDGAPLHDITVPVYLLAGEYDPVATDEDHGGPAVARLFPKIVYREMKGLSHFAPTDDPVNFSTAVIPVLDHILAF